MCHLLNSMASSRKKLLTGKVRPGTDSVGQPPKKAEIFSASTVALMRTTLGRGGPAAASVSSSQRSIKQVGADALEVLALLEQGLEHDEQEVGCEVEQVSSRAQASLGTITCDSHSIERSWTSSTMMCCKQTKGTSRGQWAGREGARCRADAP